MTCIRCKTNDSPWYLITVEGAKKIANFPMCEGCYAELRRWADIVPEGKAEQIRQLERSATSGR